MPKLKNYHVEYKAEKQETIQVKCFEARTIGELVNVARIYCDQIYGRNHYEITTIRLLF